MRIVVCVKHVPDAQGARGFSADLTADREHVDGLLSELDEYAVEEALVVADAIGAAGDSTARPEVVVLTVGPAAAADAVKRALQMGTDAGYHVQDDAIAGSDAVGSSLVLAEALRRLEPDLVLTGMSSTDGGTGVVPAMVSERLGLPQMTYAAELSVDALARTVRIRRDGDTSVETIEASLPAVVSVTDQINEPRYPSFKGIMAAKKKPVTVWGLADLGIDPTDVGLAAAWTRTLAADARPPRQRGTVVTDEGGTAATELVDFLAAHKLL
ncbi:MAG: electron transfer flavoprotein subunit beta/FixA family protein [Kineosporiaceae bacterium]